MAIIEKCPMCNNDLIISKLSCKNCGLELTGDFKIDGWQKLNAEEMLFVKKFLLVEGNMSRMQELNDMTYSTTKMYLAQINKKINNDIIKEENSTMDINNVEDKVIRRLKEKIVECGGQALMPVLKGEPVAFWLSSTQKGFESAGLKNHIFEWHIFSAIVSRANELGGRMYRGDAAAQRGARIGSDELPITTIDGYIATNFYGAQEGDTITRRSTYFAGILAWAGIVTNHRSEGKGGYITVNKDFRD